MLIKKKIWITDVTSSFLLFAKISRCTTNQFLHSCPPPTSYTTSRQECASSSPSLPIVLLWFSTFHDFKLLWKGISCYKNTMATWGLLHCRKENSRFPNVISQYSIRIETTKHPTRGLQGELVPKLECDSEVVPESFLRLYPSHPPCIPLGIHLWAAHVLDGTLRYSSNSSWSPNPTLPHSSGFVALVITYLAKPLSGSALWFHRSE